MTPRPVKDPSALRLDLTTSPSAHCQSLTDRRALNRASQASGSVS